LMLESSPQLLNMWTMKAALLLWLLAAEVVSQDVVCKTGKKRTTVNIRNGDQYIFKTSGWNYNPLQNCRADYKLDDCREVSLSCSRFQTISGGSCNWGDRLHVKAGNEGVKRFCGSNGPNLLMKSNFYLQFISDKKRSGRGLYCTIRCMTTPSTTTSATSTIRTTTSSTTTPNSCYCKELEEEIKTIKATVASNTKDIKTIDDTVASNTKDIKTNTASIENIDDRVENIEKNNNNNYYNCGENWTEDSVTGICYRVVKDRLNWIDAQKRCNLMGGDLAAIKSNQTQSFISNYLKGRNDLEWNEDVGIWFGLSDRNQENSFEWTDGTPVSYTNWLPEEPNSSGNNEDCGSMRQNHEYGWNDVPCELKLMSVCYRV